MKTLLEMKADKLEASTSCPCCSAGRTHFIKSPEHFPGETVSGDYLMNATDKAASKYACGSEFSINRHDDLVCRIPCSQPSHEAALSIQQEAEDEYATQEAEAA